MSWVVEHLKKEISQMVLRKRELELEMHDLNVTIKVLGELLGSFEQTLEEAANASINEMAETDNPYPTKMYIE